MKGFGWLSAVFIVALLLLGGCAGSPDKTDPLYAPSEPMVWPEDEVKAPDGAIYEQHKNLSLFEDFRARRVGDIVTVILAESTDAEKSSDSSLDKSNSNAVEAPLIAGRVETDLGVELSTQHNFSGESESNQSNSLNGRIAVTVARVLPNGNLYIQGEKWIKINQGNEYIRLRGMIRPVDISADNTILSTRVADARISYAGTGAQAEVNVVGWLSRFFMGPLWPF